MDDEQSERLFREKTMQVLRGHVSELNAMETAIGKARQSRAEIPNLKEIFKELSDAAEEVHSALDFYQDEMVPSDMMNVIQHTNRAIVDCTARLVAYAPLLGLRGAHD